MAKSFTRGSRYKVGDRVRVNQTFDRELGVAFGVETGEVVDVYSQKTCAYDYEVHFDDSSSGIFYDSELDPEPVKKVEKFVDNSAVTRYEQLACDALNSADSCMNGPYPQDFRRPDAMYYVARGQAYATLALVAVSSKEG